MQFDKDIEGKFSDIFIRLRKILLDFEGIEEIKNDKQTSYRDETGRILSMLRSDEEKLTMAFGQGAKMQKKFPMLHGSGKMVRHIYFRNEDEVDENLIKDMIEESIVLNLEVSEMKKLRGS